jgi:thiol:disulfide interchange protein DsbD
MKMPSFWRPAFAALLMLAAGASHAADEFLEPDQAFRLSARALDAQHVEVRFDIEPGYYLYRDKINAAAAPAAVDIAPLDLPPGKVKYDETFQKDVATFRDSLTVVVALKEAPTAPFKLTLGNQGCADKGLCYAPQQRAFKIEPGTGGALRFTLMSEQQAAAWTPGALSTALASTPVQGGLSVAPASSSSALAVATAPPVAAAAPASPEDASGVSGTLRSGRPLLVIGVFVLLGLGLSFTPCVLPMLPILSSIIVGQGKASGAAVSKARGFSLALAYSLGMALVYTAFGVASALAGEGLGAALQNAWVLGGFALLLAVFSLSMFGAYELQVPAALQSRLTQASQGFQGGQHLGVFVMGGISSLIVGPCVAAPLAGALVYISQTRDVLLGGMALFSMAVGMSVPLLLLGLSAGAVLPRAGAWMDHVKHAFGVMLLGTALWMVSPVLPTWALMLFTALLLVVAAVYLGALQPLPKPAAPLRQVAKGVGLLLCVMAVAQVVGAASGGRSWLHPLAQLRAGEGAATAEAELKFQPVSSLAELDAAVRASTRPVMLDFYADWCVSCKEFEKFTFTDPAVRQKMAGLTLLRADVTANNAEHKALLRQYTLFGPPAMLFFAPAGAELAGVRVIGFQSADKFSEHLDRVDGLAGARVGMN